MLTALNKPSVSVLKSFGLFLKFFIYIYSRARTENNGIMTGHGPESIPCLLQASWLGHVHQSLQPILQTNFFLPKLCPSYIADENVQLFCLLIMKLFVFTQLMINHKDLFCLFCSFFEKEGEILASLWELWSHLQRHCWLVKKVSK